jgi:hypothetical protein
MASRNRSYKFYSKLKFKLRKAKPILMPDESCRNCGGKLINCSLCAECRGVLSMICVSCGTRTLEQFHDSCMYVVEQIQTTQTLSETTDFLPKIVAIS